jgi:VCBS repeat-containing protein
VLLVGCVLSPVVPVVAAPVRVSGPVVVGSNGPDVIDRSTAVRAQTIRGRGGADVLTGSRFGDSISGGTGRDRLVGGPGADTLAGDQGNDSFVFGPGDLRATPGRRGRGADRVIDFTGAGTVRGTQDKVVLDGFGAGARLVFQRTVPGIFGVPRRRAQVYRVVKGSGVVVGRVTVFVRGVPVRRLNAADVSVVSTPVVVPPVVPPVVPVNRAPVLAGSTGSGSVTQTTSVGGTLTASGSIGWADADGGQAHTASAVPLTGSPVGSLSASVSGSTVGWVYTVSNDALRHLGAGATVQERFRVTLSDSGSPAGTDTAEVTITQHGVNDKPVSAGALADQGVSARSTASWVIPAAAFSDPDDADPVDPDTFTLSAAGAGGSNLPSWLVFNAGTRTFTATPKDDDLGATTVVVTATDSHGASVAEALKVTVSAAANEAPVLAASGLTGSVTQVAATGQTRADGGVVGFTDADTLQSHTVSVTPVNAPTGP